MNFVATHDCGLDYREFRNATAEPSQFPRRTLTKLPFQKKVEAAPEQ